MSKAWWAVATCIAALSSPPAEAGVVLWRTLEAGDTPDAVKAKLEVMPEVKRVKNIEKRGVFSKQDVNMNDGGVPIFEGHFSIDTTFANGGLSTVRLTSGAGCLDDAYPVAQKIADELARKYPEVAHPLADSGRFTLRALDSTDARSTEVSSGYLSDDVGVLFQSTFIRVDPPTYYGGSALNRSLYQIARNTYDLGAQKCGGAYYRTAQFSISYFSRAYWEAIREASDADHEADRHQAAGNL